MKFRLEIKPVVVLGPRVYIGQSWKRRDTIYHDGLLIGFIHLLLEDRMGFTVSLRNQFTKKGRAIQWCVLQSRINLHRPLPEKKRTFNVKTQESRSAGNNVLIST